MSLNVVNKITPCVPVSLFPFLIFIIYSYCIGIVSPSASNVPGFFIHFDG